MNAKELTDQRNRCQVAIETAGAELATLLKRQKDMETALDSAIRAELRTGDSSGVDAARSKLLALDAEIDGARRRARLARSEIDAIEAELRTATAQEQQALRDKAAKMSREVEKRLRADRTIRGAIVESMALYWVGYGGNGAAQMNWEGHVLDLFPAPGPGEFEAAIESAQAKLGAV